MSQAGNQNVQSTMFEHDPLASDPTKFTTYIRPIMLDDVQRGWAVYSEDGEQMAVFASHEAAYFSARQSNLNPVNVH